MDKLFLLEKSFHPEPKSVSPNFTQLAHFQALETSRPSSARPQAPVHGHSTPALSLTAAQHAVTAGSATSRSEPTTSPAPNPRGWRALSSRGFLVTHRRIFSAETLGHRRGRVEAAPGLSAPAGTGRRRGSAADAGGDLSGRRGALQRRGGAGVGGGPAGAGPGARVRGRRRGMARARVRAHRHSQPTAQQPGRHTHTRTPHPPPARPPARGGGGGGGPARAGRRRAGPRGARGRRAGGEGARGPACSAPILGPAAGRGGGRAARRGR